MAKCEKAAFKIWFCFTKGSEKTNYITVMSVS